MWIILCLLLIHEVVLVGSFTTSKRVKVQTGSSLFPQCSTCHQRYLHRVFPSVLHASSDPSSAFFGTGSSNGGKDKKVNGAEKLDFDEDFYSVLEVSTTVTPEELKKAYYRLVAKYHPDSRQTEADKELGNQQMMVINNAYRILREEETRKAYDVRRRMGYRGNRAHVKEDNQQNEKPPTKSSNQNKEPNPFGFGTKTREESAEEEAWRRRKQQMEDSRNRYQQPAADQQTYSSRTSEKSASSSFTSSKSQQSEDEIFGVGRGDGSLHSLKLYLKSLQTKKDSLKSRLLLDNRDWGEVKDATLIKKRLADIEELKDLNMEISHLEFEIETKSDPKYSGNQNGNGQKTQFKRDYDPYQRNPYEPQPQTQPQRQRGGGISDWDRLRTTAEDPNEGRLWRDSRRQYRSPPPASPPPSGNKMSASTTVDQWDVDDFLRLSDEYRSIADQYEDFSGDLW